MATSNRQDTGDLEQSAVLVEIIRIQLKDGVPKKTYSANSSYNMWLIMFKHLVAGVSVLKGIHRGSCRRHHEHFLYS